MAGVEIVEPSGVSPDVDFIHASDYSCGSLEEDPMRSLILATLVFGLIASAAQADTMTNCALSAGVTSEVMWSSITTLIAPSAALNFVASVSASGTA